MDLSANLTLFNLDGCYFCFLEQIRSEVNLLFPFLLPSGVVDGRLLQGQACVGVQNHGGFHKGAELCAASVAPPMGRNRPCGLQRVALLQQTPEQHPGRRLAGRETREK